MKYSFVLTGGGTGGHVFPALAVAQVLRERGHRVLFIGTREGIEARLVAEAGYDMEFVRSGALNRVGLRRRLQTAYQAPLGVWMATSILRRFRPRAVFSMGGFVAGPVVLATLGSRLPLIVMEPNAVPGFANRKVARYVYRALLGFDATRRWFPPSRSEVTGLPVRSEFFAVEPKKDGIFTVLVTGGSRGSHTLNKASRESWPLFRRSGSPIRLIHQTGTAEYEVLAREFAESGLHGEVMPFIRDMANTFRQTDVVISRAGAGAVNEIAAARMASVLVPFPFAADDHQRRNAEVMVEAGAARMVLDGELTGERLFAEAEKLRTNPAMMHAMRSQVTQFAKPGAAERAADVMEQAASLKFPRKR